MLPHSAGRRLLLGAGRSVARWSSSSAQAALPVLSAADWHGGPERRDRFAAELRAACEQTGFFYLKDHGCEALLKEAEDGMRRFFALPQTVKESVAYQRSTVWPPTCRGWQTKEWLDPARKGRGDTKETFQMGHEAPQTQPPESDPFLGPNLWPDELPQLRPQLTDTFEAFHSLGVELCRAFAFSVGTKDLDVFARECMGRPMVMARALYYPEASLEPDEMGCSAHTDYGVLSLLHQTGNGLQVLRADGGQWIDVPPLEGCLVCNIADLMERWTNGRYVSSVHRVMVPPGAPERYCFGFFLDTKFETRVEPLPECCGDEPPKYGPVVAGEFKVQKTRVQYGQDVDEKLFSRTFLSASAANSAVASAPSNSAAAAA